MIWWKQPRTKHYKHVISWRSWHKLLAAALYNHFQKRQHQYSTTRLRCHWQQCSSVCMPHVTFGEVQSVLRTSASHILDCFTTNISSAILHPRNLSCKSSWPPSSALTKFYWSHTHGRVWWHFSLVLLCSSWETRGRKSESSKIKCSFYPSSRSMLEQSCYCATPCWGLKEHLGLAAPHISLINLIINLPACSCAAATLWRYALLMWNSISYLFKSISFSSFCFSLSSCKKKIGCKQNRTNADGITPVIYPVSCIDEEGV